MTDPGTMAEARCGQCGSTLVVEHGSLFAMCESCGTTSYVDKTRVVFHYALQVTVREEDALPALRRWMAGNQTVKDLDRKAETSPPVFSYFPMWLVKAQTGDGERVFVRPAAALAVSELQELTVPAADLQPYDRELDGAAVAPSVPYETMQAWLAEGHGIGPDAMREVSLVHVPIYTCKYVYGGRRYTAVVDAASSRVFANLYPSKWEAPYRVIGFAAVVAYFCAAWIPPLFAWLRGGGGIFSGLGVYLLVAAGLAIPIFLMALLVSAKV